MCGYVASVLAGLPLLITIGIAVCLVARRRWVALGVLIVLSPVFVSFVLGAVGYATGTAKLRSMGLPGTEFHNPDRQTRCGRQTGGSLVNGGEFIWHTPNNAAVRLMAAMFGPVPGSYDGPYPTRAEAVAALEEAEDVPLGDLMRDSVEIGRQETLLGDLVGARLLQQLPIRVLAENIAAGRDVDEQERQFYGQVTGAIWRQRCLILRIPSDMRYGLPDGPGPASAMIVLIDRQAGRPFAYYGQGGYSHELPPVSWAQ